MILAIKVKLPGFESSLNHWAVNLVHNTFLGLKSSYVNGNNKNTYFKEVFWKLNEINYTTSLAQGQEHSKGSLKAHCC